MPDRLQIELDAADLQATLAKTVAQLQSPTSLLHAIGGLLERRIQGRFETKTDPSGAPWKPHAASTLKRYQAQGHRPNLLIKSGNMLGGVAYNLVSGDTVEVGLTNQSYAGYHITGTRHMPRRDPLFATINASLTQGTLGQGDEAAVREEIQDFLAQSLGS